MNILEEFWSWIRPHAQHLIEMIRIHCSRLCETIRDQFVPTTGTAGFRAWTSRFANLWFSGVYGKVAIIGVCLVICLVWSIFNADDGVLIEQSGRQSKEWYAKFEEEPYGVVGMRGLKPIGTNHAGLPIFRFIPALSEVKSAFIVDSTYGMRPSRCLLGVVGAPTSMPRNPNLIYEFPPISDRAGRIMACKTVHEKQIAVQKEIEATEAQRRVNDMLHDMRMRAMDADIAAENRRIDNDIKRRAIMDRQHDYDMSKASGMTLSQWDTYKRTPDAISLDRNGVYKGADGDTYQIDSSGFKWWLYKGNRVPVH